MSLTQIRRQINVLASASKASTRTETYQGREHLVVPVVAIMEGVVWPVNAETPELVLASELARAPKGWNGRPVMMGHPVNENGPISANEPAVLEQSAFGHIFNAELRDSKLAVEAWFDVSKAAEVEGAQEIIERIVERGEMIEVSVGVFLTLEESEGEYNGQKYFGIWRNLVPDHLAMLPEGEIGACSNEMGCGTPRAAMVHLMSNKKMVALTSGRATKEIEMHHLLAAARDKWQAAKELVLKAAGMSDRDLRDRLSRALNDTEPAFIGVESVFPDDGQVVYATYNHNNGELQFFRRGYAVAAEGDVTLKEDREEVRPVTQFEAASSSTGGCSCHKKPVAAATNPGEENMTKEARIQALIDNPKSSFTAAHKSFLTTCTDDQLKTLEDAETARQAADTSSNQTPPPPAQPSAPATPTTPAPAAPAAPATPATPSPSVPSTSTGKVQTEAEFIETAPVSMRDFLREGLRAATAQKEGLIKALKDSGRCDYNDAELTAMGLNELQRLTKLASVAAPEVDYSLSAPRAAETGKKETVPAPPNMGDRIRAAGHGAKHQKKETAATA